MVKRKQKLNIDGEIVREPQAAINDSRSLGPMNYAWELEDLAEVIEESHHNPWKSQSKGIVSENPKWENAPSFKCGAVRNCQVTATRSSICPEDLPWRLGSPRQLIQEAHTCPVHRKTALSANLNDKILLSGINLMNIGLTQPCFTTFLASLLW